ncbi:MAG: two-component system, chemotaxis family, protein-glutamate methylesterase/glutaminase [Verrucomicrobiota bacterium]|jgi:CheY-like chemotaxis protein
MAQKKKRILFVDDDLTLLEILQQLMTHYAGETWEVITAPDVSKALGILQEGRIDLLVFDIHMPVVDGVQFLGLLQRKYPNLLKVVLTGAASEETRATCLSSGAELYIEKPKDNGGWQSIHATLHELTRFQPEDGFRGVLRQVGLQDVLQMECLARHSVVLHIRAESVDGKVFVKDGQIIHAQCADRKGEEAFNQLLSLTGGEFDLLKFSQPPEQTISGSWEFLLMEAARQRDEGSESEAETPGPPIGMQEIPDMFPVPQSGAPAIERHAASPGGAPAILPQVELPPAMQRLAEAGPELPLPAEASRPRTDELLICSLQGEVLHEWKCANPNGRVGFLEFVSQKARQLAQGLPVGDFDRIEVNGVNTRVIAQIQADRALFVRCSRVSIEGEGNSFGA